MIQKRLLPLPMGARAVCGAALLAFAFLVPCLVPCLAAAQNAPTPGQNDSDDDQPVPVPAPPPTVFVPAPPPVKITIRILDSKTGAPIKPTNLIIHIDHKDEPYNEGLKLNDDYTSTALVPADAKVLSVEGAYASSMESYVNCDTDTGKDGGALKWYSIADILKTGLVTSNLCFRGKYQNKLKVSTVPGEFVFFVRTHNWHDGLAD